MGRCCCCCGAAARGAEAVGLDGADREGPAPPRERGILKIECVGEMIRFEGSNKRKAAGFRAELNKLCFGRM